MNAFLTLPGRRFLPLLAIGSLLAGLPSFAHADLLSSRLTDRATDALSNSPGFAARVIYDSPKENPPEVGEADSGRAREFTALALTLIVPSGTSAVIAESPSPPPPPPPPPPPSTPPNTPQTPPGGGQISGYPEPGTLVLALTGSGTALLSWFRRRRTSG